jgi:WD40 repeat protein
MLWRHATLGLLTVFSLGGLILEAQQPAKGDLALSSLPSKTFGSDLLRHGSRIQCLTFAPKGAFPDAPDAVALVAGGGDDPIRVWNAETGQRVKTIDMPWTQALAWSPNARLLVAGNAFRTLRVVTPQDIKHENAPAAIRAIAISPEGKPILAGMHDGQILLYIVSTRKASVVPAHKGEVNALAAAPVGKLFASGGADRSIILWKMAANLDTLEKVHTFASPGMVNALVFTPDGKTLISAGDDRVIRFWDVDSGKQTNALEGHRDTVAALALSGDGKTLVSTSRDDTACVWNVETFKKLHTVPIRSGDADALALSPDAKLFAVAGGNQVIRLFDTDTGKERLLAPGPQAPLVKMALAPAQNTVTTLTATGDIHQWDAKANLIRSWPIKTTPAVQQDVVLVRSPDEAMLLTGSSAQPSLELWETATGKSLGSLPLPAGESLVAAAFSSSGKTIALAFRSGQIHFVDWPSRDVRAKAKTAGAPLAIAFCPDRPVAATASGGKVQLWDVPTGQALRHFLAKEDAPENQQPAIADLAFSPDGRTLAIAGFDAVIRLFDWTSGKLLMTCEGHKGAVTSVAFAPDGHTFASTSFDKTVRLWETSTGKTVETLKGHEGPVTQVAFAPNCRAFSSCSADGRVLSWDPTASILASPGPLDGDKRKSLWHLLANENAALGQSATWRWVAAPKDAPEFLGSQVYLLDPKKVDQLFRDLDAKEFLTREKATQELEKYGRWMEGRLETALNDPPSLEVKRRIERMLGLLRVNNAITLKQERIRMLRIMQALEQIGDQPSIKVLDDLARGAAEPGLQVEAELALKRLQKSR